MAAGNKDGIAMQASWANGGCGFNDWTTAAIAYSMAYSTRKEIATQYSTNA